MKDFRLVDLAGTMRPTTKITTSMWLGHTCIKVLNVTRPTSRHKKSKIAEANDEMMLTVQARERIGYWEAVRIKCRVGLGAIAYSTSSGRLSRYKNPEISENKSRRKLVVTSKKEEKDKGKAERTQLWQTSLLGGHASRHFFRSLCGLLRRFTMIDCGIYDTDHVASSTPGHLASFPFIQAFRSLYTSKYSRHI